ncbi:MAG TPA: 2Fe-2S iron-sulfur cluster binding domain-containing protein [Myxococcota bacterium]|nr:2Fe-2S iron-sulfur cluster binding domain-containing protein [Myxococcota bacterium]
MRARGRVTETLVRPGQTLLEAGLQAGVAMPFSCTMGGCGACRVKLVGDVVHDEPNGVSSEERAAGWVFACVARPMGPCAVELV